MAIPTVRGRPFRLSKYAVKKIESSVDKLFDRAKVRVLGAWSVDKNIVVTGADETKTLPGLYATAAAQHGTLEPNKNILRAMLAIPESYIEAQRAATKARVVQAVASFLTEAHAKGVETDVPTVLGGQLAEVFGKVTSDMHRIIDTEAQNVRNGGALDAIMRVNADAQIEDPVVYYVVVRDEHLCDECKKLHLLDDKVTPRCWYLSELGHGYHKRGDAFPALGGEHPHCRCTLVTLMPGYGFTETGMVHYVEPGHKEIDRQRGLGKSELNKAGEKFHDFFSNVTQGKAGTSSVPYQPVLQVDPNSVFNRHAAEHVGNFDAHIGRSIPGYPEVTTKIGDAIMQHLPQGGRVLDIGASDASFGKAIAAGSKGNIHATSIDPNEVMHSVSASRSVVPGHEYRMESFLEPYTEGGKTYPAHRPSHPYDVVHEGMTFQFMGPDRDRQVTEVKGMMHPHGVFVSRQKFKTDNYAGNEALKDQFKGQYFPQADIEAKAKTVLPGMGEGQVHVKDYETTLKRHFKHVEPFWDAGNFKGYLASDSRPHLDSMKSKIGDTSSRFSEVQKAEPIDRYENTNWYMPHGSPNATEIGGFITKVTPHRTKRAPSGKPLNVIHTHDGRKLLTEESEALLRARAANLEPKWEWRGDRVHVLGPAKLNKAEEGEPLFKVELPRRAVVEHFRDKLGFSSKEEGGSHELYFHPEAPAIRLILQRGTHGATLDSHMLKRIAQQTGTRFVQGQGFMPDPQGAHAAEYRRRGLLPDEGTMRTWTPHGEHQHVELGKLAATGQPEPWKIDKFTAQLTGPQAHRVPPIQVVPGEGDGYMIASGDEQYEAAKRAGMTHAPVQVLD